MTLIEGLLGERIPEIDEAPLSTEEEQEGAGEARRRLGSGRIRSILVGVLTVLALLVVHAEWIQPALASREQGQRLTALKAQLASPKAPRHLPQGAAAALLEIPRLGFEQVVVVGTGAAQLSGGPGLVDGSALPGQAGLVEIAGRRWTSGAPFGQIPGLHSGDAIVLTDRLGKFRYVVAAPGDRGRHQSELALVTAAGPSGSLTSIRAGLAGEAAAERAPGHKADRRAAAARAELGSWFSDPLAILAVLVLLVVLAGALAISWRAYRTRPRRLVWLLSTPVLVALALALLSALGGLLPPVV